MRKAILPILTVGLVVMLAGAGSLAYFSDSEETSGRFEAGTLVLEYNFYSESNWGPHEEVEDPFELEDVKPGDNGCFTYELKLSGNPAYICAEIELVESDDNIRDSMEFKIEWSGQETDWFTWENDDQVMCKQFGEMQPGEDNVEICWRISTDVGNEIQGQSLELEIRFKAEQVRHREDMVFGIALDGLGLYRIYPRLGEAELIEEEDPIVDRDRNALGYDLNRNRLYFAGGNANELHYYDFGEGSVTIVGELEERSFAGAMMEGNYYYVPDDSNDLRRVVLDATGDSIVDDDVIVEDIRPGIDPQMGDIDFASNGTRLVGSSSESYFVYDMDSEVKEYIDADRQYQLAFGPDGTLWANHHEESMMRIVEDPLELDGYDHIDEKLEEVGDAGVGGEGYKDLAGWWPCQRE